MQYRGTVGVFNNRKFTKKLQYKKMYQHKFDVICLFDTYLDSTVASDDENLEIAGHNLVLSDHPANTKRG